MSSAVTSGPNQNRRPSTSSSTSSRHPPGRSNPGEQRRIVLLHAGEHPRHLPVRSWPRSAGRARMRRDRREGRLPPESSSAIPPPRAASATGTASTSMISSVPGSRRLTSAEATPGKRSQHADRRAERSSKTLASGAESQRRNRPSLGEDTEVRRFRPVGSGRSPAGAESSARRARAGQTTSSGNQQLQPKPQARIAEASRASGGA